MKKADIVFDAGSLPPLPGYLSVAEAAEILGLAKVSVLEFVYTGRFKTAFRLGRERPMVALAEAEVLAMKQQRALGKTQVAPPSLADRRSAWRVRVMNWAAETGWTETIVRRKGFLQAALREAYEAANPEDRYPNDDVTE